MVRKRKKEKGNSMKLQARKMQEQEERMSRGLADRIKDRTAIKGGE